MFKILNPNKLNKKYFKAIFLVIVLLVLISLISLSMHQQPDPLSEEENPAVIPVISYSTDTPSEEPVLNTYQTASDLPRAIMLPTINTKGFIQQVDVDQNNQIAVPDNIYMAGWYINSVKPGQKGLSIIDGHVDGLENNGVFFSLKDLKTDDKFTVEYGDGSTVEFVVKKIVEVKTENAAEILFSKEPKIKSQLNLITCIGVYNSEISSYESRLIVIAEAI